MMFSPIRRRRAAALPLIGLLVGLSPLALEAQQSGLLEDALKRPEVAQGLASLGGRTLEAAALLTEIGGIVSPSGEERQRAERVAEEMRRIGLQDVRVDDQPNAMGWIPGRSGKVLVFVSTLDDLATVAEHQRAQAEPPRIDGDRVVGPGTNTSSITVAMLEAAKAYLSSGMVPEHDLLFVAVAQEETGLTGMKALVDELGEKALGYVDILGDGRSISYGALNIHWWRVQGEGPAGHSLGGGLPNVNQGLARAADRILTASASLHDLTTRTVLNVAMLRSGEVFNHKPATGWFSLDIRSLHASTVMAIEGEVAQILAEVAMETGVTLSLVPEQLTPGGQIEGFREAPLVRVAEAAAQYLGVAPQLNDAGSSNMNVALGKGIPAIGLGGSRGGDRGFAGEWADIPAMIRSAQLVFLLAATLGGV